MTTFIDHQKAFILLFNQTARYHKRHKVFEDFVSCSVIALENRLQFSEARDAYFHERRSLNNFHRDRVITFEQIAE